jgi:ketosteroid isomerase-like protein
MAADDNLATIKGIYDSFGAGDVQAILDQLADDVDWAAVAASDAAPWYGQRKGKDEVAQFFAAVGENIDVPGFTPESFTANEDEVMVKISSSMKSKQTGREAATTLMHYWRLRDGKVVMYRGTEDTALTERLLAG